MSKRKTISIREHKALMKYEISRIEDEIADLLVFSIETQENLLKSKKINEKLDFQNLIRMSMLIVFARKILEAINK